jgi:hypothetical protein
LAHPLSRTARAAIVVEPDDQQASAAIHSAIDKAIRKLIADALVS